MLTLPERIATQQDVLDEIKRQISSEIRVSMPCIVTKFDANKQTVDCIPAIRELVNINGKIQFTNLPELKEVPIEIPRAGNFAITLPITVGQECRVTFQDLCIDGWWVRGGVQNWNDLRRHDLSDAIATFSPWSQPNSISNYSTDSLDIRSLDGSKTIAIKDDEIDITCGDQSKITVKESEIYLQMGSNSVKISASGIELTGIVIINGTPYLSHQHTGVTAGNQISGGVSQ